MSPPTASPDHTSGQAFSNLPLVAVAPGASPELPREGWLLTDRRAADGSRPATAAPFSPSLPASSRLCVAYDTTAIQHRLFTFHSFLIHSKMKRASSDSGSPHSPVKESQYLVTPIVSSTSDKKVRCLVCHIEVRDKTYNIKRHYTLKHANDYENIVGDERKGVIEKLKSELPGFQEVRTKL